jgi:dTDP-4-dehydrorhamnose reductase
MKTLIIGASGLVGSHLLQTCQRRCWDVLGTYHTFAQPGLIPLKLTDSDEVRSLIQKSQPDVVFLPAFRSNVDYCEQNPEETYQINVVGCLNVAQATRDVGAKLVFYSSDYVFNGNAGPYRETDEPDPICVYGQQKLEVEQKIAELLENYLILRITVVYGHEAQAKNFVDRLITNLKNGQTMKVPQDQVGSPTLVDDIAEASCRLVEAGATGIFHVAGPEVIGRYQFALDVAEVFGLPTENIMAVNTSELGQPAQRPLKAGMVCDHLAQTLNWNLRGVFEGLSELKATQRI